MKAALSLFVAQVAQAFDHARFLFLRVNGPLDGGAGRNGHRDALRGDHRIENLVEWRPVQVGRDTEQGKQRCRKPRDVGILRHVGAADAWTCRRD